MSKRIVMTVPLNGISTNQRKVKFETDGFVGTGCEAATKAFESAIGTTVNQDHKPEYYKEAQQHEHVG